MAPHSYPPHKKFNKPSNREGYPCRLYLDVEFDKRANPARDGETLMEGVLTAVVRVLLEVRMCVLCLFHFC